MSKTPKLRFKEFSGEWNQHLLGNIIELYDNKRKPVKEQDRVNGKYAYYGATGIIDYVNSYIFEGEYLLLGEDGANIITRSAPLIYKTQGKFWVNNHAHIFKPKKQFDIEFMKQYLELIDYIPYNTGTAQPKLNTESIKSIPLKAPSNEEQQKIANFFSLIDKKIQKQQEKVEAFKDYKKGMMQKIFSQEIRFKGNNGEEYPEWEKNTLGNIFDFYTTNSFSRDCLNDCNGTVKNIHYGDIHINFPTILDVKNNNIPYINDDINLDKISKECYCKEGDIVIADASEDYADIGKTIEVKNVGNEKIIAGLHTLLGRDNKGFTVNGYRGYMFLNNNVRKQIKVLAVGSKVLGISRTNINKVLVHIPKKEEQQKISNFLSTLDKKLEKEQEKLDSLNEWKKGLLQQMFV